jgi:hypothetical protein
LPDTLAWEIGAVEDKIGAVDSKLDHLNVVLSLLSKKLEVENTTDAIGKVATAKRMANTWIGSREFTSNDVTKDGRELRRSTH